VGVLASWLTGLHSHVVLRQARSRALLAFQSIKERQHSNKTTRGKLN
jgi:hypothetical protein